MKFQFNVNVTDQDYLDYNIFWMTRSPYGKKQMQTFRIVFTVLVAAVVAVYLFGNGFSADTLSMVIPMFLLYAVFQVLLKPFFAWSLKGTVKGLKKSGKMGYSPIAVLEFYQDSFVEITPENKTEQKYTAIERISIVDNKMLYLHVNNVMAYMLPLSCFAGKEQYDAFLEFMATKCTYIDVY